MATRKPTPTISVEPARQQIGVRALLVHALSEQAAGFYEARGFHPSPLNPRTLFLPLSEV